MVTLYHKPSPSCANRVILTSPWTSSFYMWKIGRFITKQVNLQPGARFSKGPVPKTNFEIKTLLNSSTVSSSQTGQFCLVSLYHFHNYWNLALECKHGKHKTAFRDFWETGPRALSTQQQTSKRSELCNINKKVAPGSLLANPKRYMHIQHSTKYQNTFAWLFLHKTIWRLKMALKWMRSPQGQQFAINRWRISRATTHLWLYRDTNKELVN